jgi:S-DNA-T family DNA segregation ATPase FtsK/SpoIIIE
VGILPIWVGSDAAQLPAVCRTYVDVTPGLGAAEVHFIRHGEIVTPTIVEGVSLDHASSFANALTPLTDAGAVVDDSSDLPRQVTLLTLLGDDLVASAAAIIDRWQQNHSLHRKGQPARPRKKATGLRAIIGTGGLDAMHLDLREQGPHALVGGTTGSGKSEFLQAWVLGMAAEYSPDRITFLFIDYKGGAGFDTLAKLPHCVGLVTDLDSHLVRRAMTSLKAELHYREKLITQTKKAKDLLDLEKRGDPEAPPALVLVIDEFAALKAEFPDFIDNVVDLAARGRSLGIHLIMATQRPANIIEPNLRANTNLRVALRMNDEADSTDVIGTADAAFLDPDIPGRGVVRSGPGRLVAFQSAYSGGHSTAGGPKPSVVIHPLGFGADQPWEKPDDVVHVEETGPTDQDRLVTSLSKASELAEIQTPRRPWRDELARIYDLRDLQRLRHTYERTDEALVLGIQDLPHLQDQRLVTFNPDIDGNLAIYGTGGSGKTVTLRTLACGAAVTPGGGPIDIYCLDFASGGLKMLEELPHVGAVIPGDDAERVERLFRTLRDVADRRAQTYPAEAATIADYRRLTGTVDEHRILVLIDGYPAFREQWETGAGRAPTYGIFQQLLTSGKRLGIHVAFTADRPAAVPGAVSSSVPRRVVLRLADDTMYFTLDARTDVLGPSSPPGRSLVDNEETQIAIFGGSPNGADQQEAIRSHAAAIAKQGRAPTPAIRTLPSELRLDMLPAGVSGQPVLGLNVETLAPVGFAPEGVLLVGGGPGSGRTNALRALARSIQRTVPDDLQYYLASAQTALAAESFWTEVATGPEDVADLAKRLTDQISDPGRHITVVVDGVADFLSPMTTTNPAEAALIALFKAARASPNLVVVESETSSWKGTWPLLAEIKSARRGILLQPESSEGEVYLGTTFPRGNRADFPPGRGVYADGGKAVKVQLPLA